jgi:hypothetical protein
MLFSLGQGGLYTTENRGDFFLKKRALPLSDVAAEVG